MLLYRAAYAPEPDGMVPYEAGVIAMINIAGILSIRCSREGEQRGLTNLHQNLAKVVRMPTGPEESDIAESARLLSRLALFEQVLLKIADTLGHESKEE